MKQILILLIILFTISSYAQKQDKYNLGFENPTKDTVIPNWQKKNDGVTVTLDSTIKLEGKYSLKITSNTNFNGIRGIQNIINKSFEGEEIELVGYLKTNNVSTAYIYMVVGDENTDLSFQMSPEISGTSDWQKLSIKIPYTSEATKITVACNIGGSGEVWLDNFSLNIDGKNIETLKEFKPLIPKAQLDKEFDNGSSIELTNLTSENIKNLELLGRVWGFIKYHHPEIAIGNYNWDYELFRFLPKYIEAKNDDERNNLLVNWIASLGTVKKCSKCKPTAENAKLKPDLKWVQEQDAELRDKLLYVYNNRSQGDQYYLELFPHIKNPNFIHENGYSNMAYPDAGFRLLALFRYWNMINYFYPYKYLMDKNWNTVLREYIPLFVNAKDELEYELAVLQVIGDIQDTHANLWEGGDKIKEWRGANYAPVQVRFIENQLVVTDYYNEELRSETGLEIGDIIKTINGQNIEQIIKEKSKYYPASNVPTRLRDMSGNLLRSNDSEIEISYVSDGSILHTKMLKLYPRDSLNIYSLWEKSDEKSYKMLDNNIGYVTLRSIKEEDIEKIKKEFKDTKGIIIDIRNYPSSFVTYSLGSYFVSSSTPFAKFTNGNIDNPGEFTFTKNEKISGRGKTYKPEFD